MTISIAIIGNSQRNVGAAMAGDLALGGHDVRLALEGDETAILDAVREAGGVKLNVASDVTLSKRNGVGVPRILTEDPVEAAVGADLVVLDVEAADVEVRAAAIIPHLENGQVLYVNTHGYWPALRLAPALREVGKEGMTVIEGMAPNLSAKRAGAEVSTYFLRRDVPIAVFPADRAEAASKYFPLIMGSWELRRCVIETNLENINLLVHPAMSLLNVGYYDRAEAAGDTVSFYGIGNTVHAGKLAEALDAERPAVCDAFGVRFRSLVEHIHRLYGGAGDSVHEAVKQSPVYQNSSGLSPDIWRSWMADDVPLAHVPFVLLAESAGVPVPLHRGFVDIIDALLGTNSWQDGLTLDRLGLAGKTPEQIRTYVETGQ